MTIIHPDIYFWFISEESALRSTGCGSKVHFKRSLVHGLKPSLQTSSSLNFSVPFLWFSKHVLFFHYCPTSPLQLHVDTWLSRLWLVFQILLLLQVRVALICFKVPSIQSSSPHWNAWFSSSAGPFIQELLYFVEWESQIKLIICYPLGLTPKVCISTPGVGPKNLPFFPSTLGVSHIANPDHTLRNKVIPIHSTF